MAAATPWCVSPKTTCGRTAGWWSSTASLTRCVSFLESLSGTSKCSRLLRSQRVPSLPCAVSPQGCRVKEEGATHPHVRCDSSQRGMRHHWMGQQHRRTATDPHQTVQRKRCRQSSQHVRRSANFIKSGSDVAFLYLCVFLKVSICREKSSGSWSCQSRLPSRRSSVSTRTCCAQDTPLSSTSGFSGPFPIPHPGTFSKILKQEVI